jgi:hypothetical protein
MVSQDTRRLERFARWTTITLMGSHLRSSRMAPCLSKGRLPSLAEASELRDVGFSVGEWPARRKAESPKRAMS